MASGALHGMVMAAQEQFADFPFRINEMRLQAHIWRHSGGWPAVIALPVGGTAEAANEVGSAAEGSLFFLPHAELGSTNFRDFYGQKVYSNHKVGKLAAEALAGSGHSERIMVTPERLDGEALTV